MLGENVRRGIVPKWACAEHNLEDMHVRMAPDLKILSPTQRVQKEAARGNKRRLAVLVPSNGTRFRTHIAQAEIVDLTGLGGAAASPAVRTSHGVAAALQDDGLSRPAARVLEAFAADSAGQSSGQRSEPPPGALAAVDVIERRASVVTTLQEQLNNCRSARRRLEGSNVDARRRWDLEEQGRGRTPRCLDRPVPFLRSRVRSLSAPPCGTWACPTRGVTRSG